MFRIGGVAEGITSGLDQTQLTASRPGYDNGNIVLERTKESFPEYQKALQDIRGERRSYLPQFLMSMGLDLATRPRSGNILNQIAASAKGPLDKWMETRASREGVDDKLASALFGDVIDIETKKELQRKKLESEERQATIKAGEGKEFDVGQAAKIDQLRKNSYQQKLDLENELGRLKAITDPSEEDLARIQQIEKAELPAVQGTINDLEGAETTLQKIQQAGQQDNFNDMIDKNMDENDMTFEEAFTAALKFFDDLLSQSKATGGRVGYQNAGPVMPGQPMQASMPMNQGAGTMDQGQDDSVQNLSFEELRARLPQEITDDIIQLIASSKQALVEFANIRTQQDVNAFNQKYDVNLVVPQEA
jgi:hypothetical protein